MSFVHGTLWWCISTCLVTRYWKTWIIALEWRTQPVGCSGPKSLYWWTNTGWSKLCSDTVQVEPVSTPQESFMIDWEALPAPTARSSGGTAGRCGSRSGEAFPSHRTPPAPRLVTASLLLSLSVVFLSFYLTGTPPFDWGACWLIGHGEVMDFGSKMFAGLLN